MQDVQTHVVYMGHGSLATIARIRRGHNTNLAPAVLQHCALSVLFLAASLISSNSAPTDPVFLQNPRGWNAAKQALADQPQTPVRRQETLQPGTSEQPAAAFLEPSYSSQGPSQTATWLCLAAACLGFALGWYLRGKAAASQPTETSLTSPILSPAGGQDAAEKEDATALAEQAASAQSSLTVAPDLTPCSMTQPDCKGASHGNEAAALSNQAAAVEPETGDSTSTREPRVSEPESPGAAQACCTSFDLLSAEAAPGS